jgi:uncharacterized protein
MKQVLFLITLLLTTTLAWSDYSDNKSEDNPLLSGYIEAAEQGSAEAQVALGTIYLNGEGTLQNYEEAYKWYQVAADQGNAHAMFNIGVMHDKGYHFKQDFDEAAKWYRKAADLGFPQALFNIGIMYEYGQAVPKDYEKAHEYYLMAAEKGDPSAQFSIGLMYDKGMGVEQNDVTAYMWWDITGKGYIHAEHNRDSLAEDMTPEQIAEAKRLANIWREEHAHVKQLPAQEFLPGFE